MTSDLGIVPWTRREFQHEMRGAGWTMVQPGGRSEMSASGLEETLLFYLRINDVPRVDCRGDGRPVGAAGVEQGADVAPF